MRSNPHDGGAEAFKLLATVRGLEEWFLCTAMSPGVKLRAKAIRPDSIDTVVILVLIATHLAILRADALCHGIIKGNAAAVVIADVTCQKVRGKKPASPRLVNQNIGFRPFPWRLRCS